MYLSAHCYALTGWKKRPSPQQRKCVEQAFPRDAKKLTRQQEKNILAVQVHESLAGAHRHGLHLRACACMHAYEYLSGLWFLRQQSKDTGDWGSPFLHRRTGQKSALLKNHLNPLHQESLAGRDDYAARKPEKLAAWSSPCLHRPQPSRHTLSHQNNTLEISANTQPLCAACSRLSSNSSLPLAKSLMTPHTACGRAGQKRNARHVRVDESEGQDAKMSRLSETASVASPSARRQCAAAAGKHATHHRLRPRS